MTASPTLFPMMLFISRSAGSCACRHRGPERSAERLSVDRAADLDQAAGAEVLGGAGHLHEDSADLCCSPPVSLYVEACLFEVEFSEVGAGELDEFAAFAGEDRHWACGICQNRTPPGGLSPGGVSG